MKSSQKIAILVPAFNEAKKIAEVVSGIKKTKPELEVVVIDDGSSDDTATIAEKAGATVLTHAVNLGYGAALQTGYKYALLNDYECTIQIDGDGQHDPRFIDKLISSINNGSDVVIGSRFLANNGYNNPFMRKMGMMFFRFLIYLFIKQKISDPTSGFQALNRNVITFFAKSNQYPADFPDADIIILLHYAGFHISEIPVVMYRNETGKSMHSGFKPLYYIIKMLLSIYAVLFGDQKLTRSPHAS
ncbi:glycosyltransferase family 2 protein [candidate division KSB1 bacterium]|nr:glycosyltransferase family 2 protein [candidate division KSB1 bacterium]NIR68379.1 glycosyltransferase family 2 protein [candidate division KSB1 bacterium]NIS25323.1 glycosyltransferase family 2 protein [candidate division KSB1 bacterium]NIT72234.1 glycosyltransferase family 2 protein [candidate division KSB1 bacterium]NIU26042.1 glycosyltransferase family 2 protein [candidate division KSB1 bacterium]